MPRLSVLSIRAALLYLLAGFTIGAILLANKAIPFAPWAWNLLPAHIDILLFGFVIQLAMGTAFWILPRHRSGPERGNETLVWASIAMLNLGIWIVVLSGWFGLPSAAQSAGRLLEAAAAILFAAQVWRRIRPS